MKGIEEICKTLIITLLSLVRREIKVWVRGDGFQHSKEMSYKQVFAK